ncbi:MAG: glycoside hydrolase family 25 protein [Lachnospiraceae bacterium]|nr:glycoside hydrolase family 25 protein [Lachnospiraceae bacterium]
MDKTPQTNNNVNNTKPLTSSNSTTIADIKRNAASNNTYNKAPERRKISVISVFGFIVIMLALGGVTFLFLKQNNDINATLSTLSAAQSQLYDEFASLNYNLANNDVPTTTPPVTSGTPIHTIEISKDTTTEGTSEIESTPAPTTTQAPTTPMPTTTPEPTTTPAPTTTPQPTTTPTPTIPPETTTPKVDTPVTHFTQKYVSMYLGGGEYRIPIIQTLPMHDYNWDNVLQQKNGLKYYTENGKKNSLIGVDVSSHQKEIDWNKVKASGVEYAIIRVGFRGYGEAGTIVLDEYFHTNIQAALKAGLKVGVYFFSQAITEAEAIEEAEFLLNEIKGYNITFPVVYDPEDISGDKARTDGLSGEQITNQCIAFCERIKQAGYTPMIYANKRWTLTRIDLTRLTDYDLWLAAYVEQPDIPYLFTMWQYSSTGKVDGINGSVDLNISFKDYSK